MTKFFLNPSVLLLAFGVAATAQAGSLRDDFNTSRNYLSNGVAGTIWNGVSLGTNQGNSVTMANWDANTTAPNTLTIRSTGGGWGGVNDGPYLWRLVKGDFTNTVHVTGFTTNVDYNFGGLLVRNPARTNGENWLYNAYFERPGFSAIVIAHETTNSNTSEFVVNPPYFDTNAPATWPRWLQITRVGSVLTANMSTNGTEWEFVYSADRPDLPEVLQVGLFHSTYTANQGFIQFQNFKVEGPAVNPVAPPSVASGLVVTPAANSLAISWTPGAGSVGSVVVVRKAGGITRQPVDGLAYTGDPVFGSGDNLGESNFVVRASAGNTVTVTGVTPSVPYQVAVYAYSGSGATTVYAVTNAPVSTGVPLGNINSISVSFAATNAVAVDDTIQTLVTAHFDGGGTLDVTAGATFNSATPSVATVATNGLASGLADGTTAITANYQTYSSSSNLTVIKLSVTDDFAVARDYLTAGLVGTPWNGLSLGAADIPMGGSVGGGAGQTLVADAGVTKPGRLTVRSTQTGFDSAENDGFFLYRVVSGDFSVSVQITSFDPQTYHMPGLMARVPSEVTGLENSMALVAFNEFSIGNFIRLVTSGGKQEVSQQAMPAQPFIRIQREGDTFRFYQKAHALDAWSLVRTDDRPEFGGLPMQVGIVQGVYTANSPVAEFDNLLITSATPPAKPGAASNLTLTRSGIGKVQATWTPAAGSAGSVVVVHPVMPVTRQPVDGSDYSSMVTPDLSQGYDLGGSNIVVFSANGGSVVVSNLAAIPYQFAVYSYSLVAGSTSYNLVSPATNSIYVLGVPTVNPQPPATMSRYSGMSLTIPSGAIGTPPLSYQWQKDGVNLTDGGTVSGARTNSLTLGNLTAGSAGSYTLVVTNAAGSVTSTPTVVSVILPSGKPAEASALSYRPLAFWRLGETGEPIAYDYCGGFDGTYVLGVAQGVPGPLAADGFGIFETTNAAVQLPGNASPAPVTFPALGRSVSNLTITAWIKPGVLPTDRAGIVSFTAPAETGFRLYSGSPNGLSILWNNAVSHSTIVPPVNQWSFVAMTITPTGGKLYLATAAGWQTFSDNIARPAVTLGGMGYMGSDRNIAGRYLEGVIDEVSIFDRALSGADITNLYTGTLQPPSVSLSLQRVGTGLQLSWPQGTLLESSNVSGPWSTNNTTSPYTITTPAGNKFYRVVVQ